MMTYLGEPTRSRAIIAVLMSLCEVGALVALCFKLWPSDLVIRSSVPGAEVILVKTQFHCTQPFIIFPSIILV